MKMRIYSTSLIIFILLFSAISPAEDEFTETEKGLKYIDLEIGAFETAEIGKIAVIHFSGWINDDGKKGEAFFNSHKREKPISFKIGTEKVIKGWNIGVPGMKVGGKRRLMVPSELGYGESGVGDVVPPNSDLIFEIELIEVR